MSSRFTDYEKNTGWPRKKAFEIMDRGEVELPWLQQANIDSRATSDVTGGV